MTQLSVGYDSALFAFLGTFSTLSFSAVYLPQMVLNWKRGKTEGFSTSSLIVKIIGGVFMFVNSYLLEETLPVVLYAGFTLSQYLFLLTQIAVYGRQPSLYLWILTPLVPWCLGVSYPQTMVLTNLLKPASQVLSHVPQLWLCIKQKSGQGCSITSQHFHLLGSLSGLYMCMLVPPVAYTTYLVYLNALLQSLSFYAVVLYYDGLRYFLNESTMTRFVVEWADSDVGKHWIGRSVALSNMMHIKRDSPAPSDLELTARMDSPV